MATVHSKMIWAGAVLLTLATTLLWATGSFTFFTYIGVVLHRTASSGRFWPGRLPVRLRPDRPERRSCRPLADEAGPLPALAGGLTLTALSLAGPGVNAVVAADPAAVIASGAAIASYRFGT